MHERKFHGRFLWREKAVTALTDKAADKDSPEFTSQELFREHYGSHSKTVHDLNSQAVYFFCL